MLKAPGPVMVVMVLAGSSRGRSMPVGSCSSGTGTAQHYFQRQKQALLNQLTQCLALSMRKRMSAILLLGQNGFFPAESCDLAEKKRDILGCLCIALDV